MPQLVRFTVNSSNEITAIHTIAKNDEIKLFGLNYSTNSTYLGKMKFTSSSSEFVGANDSKFRLNSSTQVFVVPFDRTDLEGYSSRMYSASASYLKNTKYYNVEAYDVSGSVSTAKAVVVYDTGVVDIDETSTIAYVTSVSSTTSSGDSDYNKKITAYIYGTGISVSTTTATLYAKESDVEIINLKPGDVILYSLNLKGYIGKMQSVVDVDGDMSSITGLDKGGDNSLNFQILNGLVYASDEDNGIYTVLIANKDNVNDITSSETTETLTVNDSTIVLQYDATATGSNTDPKVTIKDKTLFETIISYKDTETADVKKADEIMVYKLRSSTTTTKTVVYVVKR